MWYCVTVPTLEFDYLSIYMYYMNSLFSSVTVSFYFSSMAKLRFVNCCTSKRIRMSCVVVMLAGTDRDVDATQAPLHPAS